MDCHCRPFKIALGIYEMSIQVFNVCFRGKEPCALRYLVKNRLDQYFFKGEGPEE